MNDAAVGEEIRTAAAGDVRPAAQPVVEITPSFGPGSRAFGAAGVAADGIVPAPAPTAPAVDERRAVWNRLADCESGEWDGGGTPIPGSRTWSYGTAPGENGYFEGGLQFDPRTWDGFRDADMPDHAGDATPEQQIVVAERVLDAQGWRAWPVCSRKLGLRG